MNLNPSQQKAVDSHAKQIICVAGPGSGKTRVLVERIRRLIQEGTSPKEIVAVTFTNAAANEISERVGFDLGYCGTLHGFMLRLIHRRGREIGFTDRASVIDEDLTNQMIQQAVEFLNVKVSKKAVMEAIGQGPSSVTMTNRKLQAAELVASRFFRNLRAANLLTFDTVLHYGLEVLRKTTHLNYSHLFVDEVQDSSDIDAQIYEALPIENKFFVADPDQAIYSFRGGNVQNILDMTYRQGVQVIRLEDNYRCERSICQTAQRLIQHNQARVNKETRSVSNLEGIVKVSEHDTDAKEKLFVAANIMQLDPNDCAVIVRTNHLVKEFTEHLQASGIPVALRKNVDLPLDWKQAMTLVRVLNDPENDVLAYMLVEQTKGKTEADSIKLQAAAARKSINETFLGLPNKTEIADLTEKMARYGAGVESVNLMGKHIETLKPGSDIHDLILLLSDEYGASQEVSEGVTVTTYHGAKGREWPIVFLPAVEQQIIPGTRKNLNIEEERRVFYIGITRAKEALYVSFAESRKPQFGSWKPVPTTVSQFVAEAMAGAVKALPAVSESAIS